MRSAFLIRLVTVTLTAFLVISPAIAEDPADLGSGGEHHINGHAFMPSLYVEDPFVSSTFQNFTGGGMAMNLTTPFLDLDGNEVFTLEGDLFFASLGLGYQQKLGSRFALGAEMSALVRSGTNADSFFMEGADLDRQGAIWGRYLAHRGDKSQLSLGLDWSYSKVVYFSPGDFARYIADGGALGDAPLVSDTKIWTTRIPINWAYAFSPTYGIRASGAFGLYEVPETDGVTKGSHRIGVLGEMDLKHIWPSVPVGLTLGYTQNFPDDDPYTGPSGILAGLWYTAKKEFIIGLETGFMKLPVQQEGTEKVDAFLGIITIRYYF